MKKAYIRSFRAALILFVLASLTAQPFAQVKPSTPPQASPGSAGQPGTMSTVTAELLRQLDLDHDGFILQSEWNRFFAERDQDGDKRLSADEIQAGLQRPGSEESQGADFGRIAAFERLDVNKNDAIDKSEWPGKSKDFRYLDANRNGSLSREEFLAKNGRWWNETFENLDFNGDNAIVRSEWLDSDSSFNRLDRDHNGAIERREFYSPR